MTADRPDNVIALAPYRMARLARRQPPRPYLMWIPNAGFVTNWPRGSNAPTAIRSLQTVRPAS